MFAACVIEPMSNGSRDARAKQHIKRFSLLFLEGIVILRKVSFFDDECSNGQRPGSVKCDAPDGAYRIPNRTRVFLRIRSEILERFACSEAEACDGECGNDA